MRIVDPSISVSLLVLMSTVRTELRINGGASLSSGEYVPYIPKCGDIVCSLGTNSSPRLEEKRICFEFGRHASTLSSAEWNVSCFACPPPFAGTYKHQGCRCDHSRKQPTCHPATSADTRPLRNGQ
jgi:hypothetical protein